MRIMKKAKTRVKKRREPDKVETFREALLEWYDANARDLPWRYRSGATAEPYKVWLSEIMLQQTTVTAVIPYFLKFTALWPNVFALADADIDDVMREWAGLGYYARARNLHKCAQIVAYERGGVFPEDQRELMALPGIGEYTSAAIRAIAFGKPATVVDGNVERVMARVHGLSGDAKSVKKGAKDHARAYFEGYDARPGDLAQAFMDLGATVCIPRAPRCFDCHVGRLGCDFISEHSTRTDVQHSEIKQQIIPKDKREGKVYWVQDEDMRVLLHRRHPRGLLGGTVGFPTSGWEYPLVQDDFLSDLEDLEYEIISHTVQHEFTHFNLRLNLRGTRVQAKFKHPANYFWCDVIRLDSIGLPTLFSKAYRVFRLHGWGRH